MVPQAWWEHLDAAWLARNPVVAETVHIPPSCHRNAHIWLDMLVRDHGTPFTGHHDATYALALLGYQRAISLGLTPKRTL